MLPPFPPGQFTPPSRRARSCFSVVVPPGTDAAAVKADKISQICFRVEVAHFDGRHVER